MALLRARPRRRAPVRRRHPPRPWTEEGIVRLLTKRTEDAGIDPSFAHLLEDLPPDADEIDREEALARTEASYYRLLWDYAGGNPGVALHFWRSCLVVDDEDQTHVRVFDGPAAEGFLGDRPDLDPHQPAARLDDVAEVWQALVLATRDYVRRNGFDEVIVGLSGGIDSAVVAAIAGAQADALTQRPALYSAFSRAAERTPTLEGILSAARARGNRTASLTASPWPARQASALAHQRAQVQLLAQAGSTRVRSGPRKRAASPSLEPGGKTLSYRDFAQRYHSAALHS